MNRPVTSAVGSGGGPWRGLRVRVALLTTLVACASVAAMAWYAGRVSAYAWRRQLTPTPPATLARIARDIATAVGPDQPRWSSAQRVLDAGASATGKQLIVFDSSRQAVAAAPASLLRFGITLGADGTVTWQRVVADQDVGSPDAATSPESSPKRAVVRQRLVVGNPRATPIPRGPRAEPASLVEITAPLSIDVGGEPLIVGMLRRPLLVGVAVAVIGAVLVALALSARVAAPIERLTLAARTVASGDRSAWPATVPEGGTSEVAELTRAFNAMIEELGRQESLRRGMTSDVAHELRAPLTNIRCQIESMIDGLEVASPTTLASLHEECLGLQHLIDDLQDMAYGDQGRLVLSVEALDAGAEVMTVVRPLQQRASVGTAIRVGVPSGVHLVAADRRRFRQIVANLVSNAVTHTPNGVVSVAASDHTTPGFVVFEVRDTGAGIPATDLPNVFERFYRADPARARSGGGTGLGLAIVKQLVELQGGEVSIASEVGVGTTVRFTLPSAVIPSGAPEARSRGAVSFRA